MNKSNIHFSKLFIRGEASFGVWNIAGKGLAFSNSLIVIKYLSLYEYGVYQLVLAFSGLVGSFFLKILTSVTLNDILRFIGEHREDLAKRLYHQYALLKIIISIIVFFFVYAGADVIAKYYDENVASFFRIISFMFLIDTIYNLVKIVLEARLRLGLIASRPAVYQFIRLALLMGAIFIFDKFGIREILVVHVFSATIALMVIIRPFWKQYILWSGVYSSHENVLLDILKAHGKWSIIRPMIVGFSDNMRPWLIKLFVSTEAVAIVSVASVMLSVVKSVLPVNTLTYLVPLRIGDKEQSRKILSYSLKYMAFLSIILASVASIAAAYLVPIFIPQYNNVLGIFFIMLISLPLSGIGSVVATFLIALRKQKYLFYQMISKSIFTFATTLALLPFFGIWGIAIETVATALFVLILIYVYIKKFGGLGFAIDWKTALSFSKTDKEFTSAVFSEIRQLIARK